MLIVSQLLQLTIVAAIGPRVVVAQFGEIASIVGGILGAGAGPAASGAGAAAGLAPIAAASSAAGSGAAGALGGLGTLYQLAQAALQLTGTGVGIVNQASESSWFPAAVENTARMNREFQDRLLAGGAQGRGPTVGGPSRGSSSSSSSKSSASSSGLAGGLPDLLGLMRPGGMSVGSSIGPEFGKELTSHEGDDEDAAAASSIAPLPSATESSLVSSSSSPHTLSRARPPILPGLTSLLPGESPPSDDDDSSQPSINVQLPTDQQKIEKPAVEFSVDSHELPLIPPRAVAPADHNDDHHDSSSSSSSSSSTIPIDTSPQMVPELQKLLDALHRSNLTRNELAELTAQLEANNMIVQPRENTTPESPIINNILNRRDRHRHDQSGVGVVSEAQRRGVERNLQALRRALSDPPASPAAHRLAAAQQQPPMVLARAADRPTAGVATTDTTKHNTLPPPTHLNTSTSPRPRSATSRSGVVAPRAREAPIAVVSTNSSLAQGSKTLARQQPLATQQQQTTTSVAQTYEQYRQAYDAYYRQYYGADGRPRIVTPTTSTNTINQQSSPYSTTTTVGQQQQSYFYGPQQQQPSSQWFYAQQQQQALPLVYATSSPPSSSFVYTTTRYPVRSLPEPHVTPHSTPPQAHLVRWLSSCVTSSL